MAAVSTHTSRKLRLDFWDVGQGDCSVITFPDGRLVIIDTGSGTSSALPDWLKKQRTNNSLQTGAILILTHNDTDHCGCALDVIGTLGDKLSRVFMVEDHGQSETRRKLYREISSKAGDRLERLELRLSETTQELLDATFAGCRVRIECVHPRPDTAFAEAARRSPEPNRMSAVITLEVNGKRQVTWPGDAPFSVVADKCRTDAGHLLVGPHHGAPTDSDQMQFASHIAQHRPEWVWISVGTDNSYKPHGHPTHRYIESHVQHGSHVCCSQLKHCDDRSVASRSHVTVSHLALGLLPPKNKAVHCMGPLRLEWDAVVGAFVPDEVLEQRHRQRVGKLAKPLCLRKGTMARQVAPP